MQTPPARELRRASDDAILTGTLGGVARYFDLDSGRVRTIFVVLSILSAAFPGILVYLCLWFIMPAEQ